jgi:REP element-mobilizing transposase RayT
MANTYTQIHIQFVFAVKFRKCLIHESWEEELYKYITGIVQSNNHKMLSINGIHDHIHFLAGIRPAQSISDVMKEVKANSSKWINDKRLTSGKFEWQGGYGAFSYAKRDLPNVIRYIQNQKDHHKETNFLDEYRKMLDEFEIEYDWQYCFREPE